MRISDWSSDVCSSDLILLDHHVDVEPQAFHISERHCRGSSQARRTQVGRALRRLRAWKILRCGEDARLVSQYPVRDRRRPRRARVWRGRRAAAQLRDPRSPESRVGKESVRTCRSRSSPSHYNKKNKTKNKNEKK